MSKVPSSSLENFSPRRGFITGKKMAVKVVETAGDLAIATTEGSDCPLVIDAAVTELNGVPFGVSSLDGVLLANDVFPVLFFPMK